MTYDVIVIGSGPGGYVAAIRAAQLGLKTACVEKNSTFGGTCLNVGCIPSKALLQSTEYYEFLSKKSHEFGITAEKVGYDFSTMMKRKDEVVKGLVDSIATLFKKNKIDSIQGKASFTHPNEISVEGKTYTAKNFILATGSEPIALPSMPFDEKKIVSSTGALALKEVPKKMTVIGGGVIGLELASVYNRLGTKVNVIEMLDVIATGMDHLVSRTLLQILKKQGIEFELGKKATKEDLAADVVLVAVGRKPYTNGLNLDVVSEKGFVEVDSCFRTKYPHIFAIGDIIPGPMLAHRASDEGIAVAEFIAGKKSHVNYMAIPNVIYTNPEVACVGLTENEAKEMGLEVFTGVAYFRGNPRARCMGETDGFVKVIGEKKSGRLIGVHIVGPHASEMIGEAVVAIAAKWTVERLMHTCHAHPTLTEAIKEALEISLGQPIHG